jgi:hypothetical protein
MSKSNSKPKKSSLKYPPLAPIAKWVHNTVFQAHRGAIPLDAKRLLLFGNDGLTDPKVVRELELVFAWLREYKYELQGMATHTGDGCPTWVLLVESPRVRPALKPIFEMLFDSWLSASAELDGRERDGSASQHKFFQMAIAFETLAEHDLPEKLWPGPTATAKKKGKG